jgi:D-sedoheptulose 7-phosphate isomerase
MSGKMMDLANYAAKYFQKLRAVLDRLDVTALERIVRVLEQAQQNGKHIFIFGNGGSAATASHFVNDLNKLASSGYKKKFKAIGLTDNIPLITAWANDEDYEAIFVQQLDNLLSEGDVVIGLSCSGSSQNVIRAFELARQRGATTIGLLGFDGGRAKKITDYSVCFSDAHHCHVEDAHMIMMHLISNYLRTKNQDNNLPKCTGGIASKA